MSFAPDYGITDWPGLYIAHGYRFELATESFIPLTLTLTVAFLITWVACMRWSE